MPDEPNSIQAGEYRLHEALDAEGRIMKASIQLPPSGDISPADRARVIATTNEIRTKYGVTQKRLSRELGKGCSQSTVCVALGDPEKASPELIRKLNAWNEVFLRRQEGIRLEGIIATVGVVRAVRAIAAYTEEQGCNGAIYGSSGIGKTTALRVAAQENPNRIYVRLRSTDSGRTSVLRRIASAAGEDSAGSATKLSDRLVERLRGAQRLVMLDEIQHATPPALEAIRDLHDETGCPFLLAGTSDVYVGLQQARSRLYRRMSEQFASRIGWTIDLDRLCTEGGNDRPLFTEEEVRQIFRSDQVRLTRDGLQYLQALACAAGLGCLRLARRCWEMACRVARQRNVPIDRELLHRALCEQAVPHGADVTAIEATVEDTAARLMAAG